MRAARHSSALTENISRRSRFGPVRFERRDAERGSDGASVPRRGSIPRSPRCCSLSRCYSTGFVLNTSKMGPTIHFLLVSSAVCRVVLHLKL